MTLTEALDYARRNQPSLLAARARLAGSQAAADVPRTLYYPRVGLTAQGFEGTDNNSTATYVNPYYIDLPRIGGRPAGTTGWDPTPSTVAGLGLRQEIFDFGRISALEAVADAAVVAEGGRTDVTRLDVLFAVEKAFYAVLTAKGILGAADSALQRSRLDYDTAVAGVNAQLREPIELTRSEATLDHFEVLRVRAAAGVATAQSVFAAVVGVPELMLDTAGEAPALPQAPTLQRAVDDALAKDPLLRERRAVLTEQRATSQAISAELLPDISLTSTVSGRAGGALPASGVIPSGGGWIPSIPNWDAGLVLTWPLLDFGVKAREAASRALENARKAEVDEMKQLLMASVQRAYVDLLAADRALPALEKALAAARANYDQAEARFKNDLGSSVELADAQALLTTAEVDVTIGRFQLLSARAYLGRVIAENL